MKHLDSAEAIAAAKERGYAAVRAGGWISGNASLNAHTWSAVEAAEAAQGSGDPS